MNVHPLSDRMAERQCAGMLRVSLIGPVSATLDGAPLELPRSRKARALLAYLAVTRRPQWREHLLDLLWPGADGGRDRLRWTLSRLRKALESGGVQPIVTGSDTVGLDPSGAECDFWKLKEIATITPALASTASLVAAAEKARGEFLEGLELQDCYEFCIWCTAERESLRLLQSSILATLSDRLGPSEQGLNYARQRVVIDPTEAAHLGLLEQLVALGRLPEAEAHLATARRQFEAAGQPPPYRLIRYLADRHRSAARDPHRMTAPASPEPPPTGTETTRINFCRTPDNIKLAYSVTGSGPLIVRATNWYTHQELDCQSPVWQHLIDALRGGRRLLRYDRRGCGLSDRSVRDFSLATAITDLETVTDLFYPEPFVLFGCGMMGGASSIAYAARHPERVSRMILIGSAPLGWRKRPDADRTTTEAMVALTRVGWNLDNPVCRQVFTSLMFPDATRQQTQWFNELQRVSASAETAAMIIDASGDFDVTELLPQVKCPTLVLHSREDAMVPMDLGVLCATGIPQAQFVSLPSRNHFILEAEPAWPKMKAEIEAFLAC